MHYQTTVYGVPVRFVAFLKLPHVLPQQNCNSFSAQNEDSYQARSTPEGNLKSKSPNPYLWTFDLLQHHWDHNYSKYTLGP
eukprot:101204-Amphidinium_carterae.1